MPTPPILLIEIATPFSASDSVMHIVQLTERTRYNAACGASEGLDRGAEKLDTNMRLRRLEVPHAMCFPTVTGSLSLI